MRSWTFEGKKEFVSKWREHMILNGKGPFGKGTVRNLKDDQVLDILGRYCLWLLKRKNISTKGPF